VQLTVDASYTGRAARREVLLSWRWKNIWRWKARLCDDVDVSAGDITSTVRRVEKESGNSSLHTWRRAIIHKLLPAQRLLMLCVCVCVCVCVHSFPVFLHTQKRGHGYSVCNPCLHVSVHCVSAAGRLVSHDCGGSSLSIQMLTKEHSLKANFNGPLRKRELFMKELFSSRPRLPLDVMASSQSSASWRRSDVARSNGWFGVVPLRVKGKLNGPLQMLNWGSGIKESLVYRHSSVCGRTAQRWILKSSGARWPSSDETLQWGGRGLSFCHRSHPSHKPTPATPAETRQGFCSTPPSQTFHIHPPGAERSPVASLSCLAHTTTAGPPDRSRAVRSHPAHSASAAPSCALTHSVFPRKTPCRSL